MQEWRGLVCGARTVALESVVLHSSRSVQPTAHGPRAAQGGYECTPAQNRKFT